MASNTHQARLPEEEIMHSRRFVPRPTRRNVLAGALIGSTGLFIPRSVFAQDSSATPAALAEATTSQTREEFQAEIVDEFGYTEAATPGGTYIGGNVSDIQTIHPFLAEDGPSLAVIGLIYDGLIGGDLRTGLPAPTGLADYWDIAPDGVTYTFHLNQDAKWHDGQDVTAEDVQFSFDALADPEVGSAYSQTFLGSTESWRVIDEHTFEVVAKEPLWTFLNDFYSVVIPKHIWENVPVADWRTDGGATGQDPTRVVGSGAWKFQEWRQGESITVVRNDGYYQKVPYLDSYVITIWPDQTAMTNALLNGELDAASIPPADVETVEAAEGLEVAVYPTRGFTFYMTNLDPEKSELFLEKSVRQALMFALDRQAMVDEILLGFGEVAEGTQPIISYAYAPDRITTPYTYDPERARELLAEAGWTDSDGDEIVDKDGMTFAFELIYPSGIPTHEQTVAYMQDAWRDIGIDMTPRALEFPSLVETITGDHNFDMAYLIFNWDATFIQDAMFGCDQYQGGFNMVRYCNEEVDRLNAQAKRTFDEEARRELLIEVSNIINEELPVGVLHFGVGTVGYSDLLQNYTPRAWGNDPTYVWIQQ
jgi:peptide/nickel transport system substrate-binding protein